MADNKKYLLEYSEWLDSEITQRYRTNQGQLRKQKGRNALSEPDAEPPECSFSFKVEDDGDSYWVTGGHVCGYYDAVYVSDQYFPKQPEKRFFYIAVAVDTAHHQIEPRIVYSGKQGFYSLFQNTGTYFFPLAEIGDDGEIIQYQAGALVTPFRRNYFPVIKGSLNNLIEVDEGEGDEVDFKLKTQGKVEVETGEMWTGPYANQHLCTDDDAELCWKDISDSSSSSSSSSGSTSSSSSISGSSSSMIDDLDDLEPGKWYVFVRYYRNEGETQITYEGYKYNTREGFHTEGWGTELGRWVMVEYDMGDGLVYVAGYYFNAVAGGPFDTIDAAAAWWREHEWEYDPNVARPE